MSRPRKPPHTSGPGRKHTLAQIAERIAAVEFTVGTSQWSLRAARTLAAQHGVTLTQVRRDKTAVMKRWRDELPRSAAEAKAGLAVKLQAAEARALRDGRLDVHVRQLRLEAEVTGALAPIQVEVAVTARAEAMSMEDRARAVVAAYPRACAVLGVSPSAASAIEAEEVAAPSDYEATR